MTRFPAAPIGAPTPPAPDAFFGSLPEQAARASEIAPAVAISKRMKTPRELCELDALVGGDVAVETRCRAVRVGRAIDTRSGDHRARRLLRIRAVGVADALHAQLPFGIAIGRHGSAIAVPRADRRAMMLAEIAGLPHRAMLIDQALHAVVVGQVAMGRWAHTRLVRQALHTGARWAAHPLIAHCAVGVGQTLNALMAGLVAIGRRRRTLAVFGAGFWCLAGGRIARMAGQVDETGVAGRAAGDAVSHEKSGEQGDCAISLHLGNRRRRGTGSRPGNKIVMADRRPPGGK